MKHSYKSKISIKLAITIIATFSLANSNALAAQNQRKFSKKNQNSTKQDQILNENQGKAENINQEQSISSQQEKQIDTVLVTANRNSSYNINNSSIFQYRKPINDIAQNITPISAQIIADQNSG